MGLFSIDEMREIRAKAVDADLARKREMLLAWFPRSILANLAVGTNTTPALSLLTSDMETLNSLDKPSADGRVFMSDWLRNASELMFADQALGAFFNDRALIAAQRAKDNVTAPLPAAAISLGTAIVEPELVISGTLLPSVFIDLAAERAKSVARLTVPSLQNGSPLLLRNGDDQKMNGTGWLIGAKHLITNSHVVCARERGKPEPYASDIEAQVAAMSIEFDYVSEGLAGVNAPVAKLVRRNAMLDYAIVELASELVGRPPLPLAGDAVVLDRTSSFATNIIQHPGGLPRQYAIRNNLAAALDGDNLAYFTDTAGGSSGSPVCDDQWRVIALHKATTNNLGQFTINGKQTFWINVGTLIQRVIDDLQSDAALWAAIGAKVD